MGRPQTLEHASLLRIHDENIPGDRAEIPKRPQYRMQRSHLSGASPSDTDGYGAHPLVPNRGTSTL
jgi:hypothetical protein